MVSPVSPCLPSAVQRWLRLLLPLDELLSAATSCRALHDDDTDTKRQLLPDGGGARRLICFRANKDNMGHLYAKTGIGGRVLDR